MCDSLLKMNKKAQIEMIEMLMVLTVIVIMIALGVLIYYGIYIGSIGEEGEALAEQESSVLLATLALMPEFQCSLRTTNSECIDTVKLYSFKNELVNEYKGHYASFFGFKKIMFERVYPIPLGDDECEVSDDYQKAKYPDNCAYWVVYENILPNYAKKTIISTPVSLYYPNTKESAIGKLVIESYYK